MVKLSSDASKALDIIKLKAGTCSKYKRLLERLDTLAPSGRGAWLESVWCGSSTYIYIEHSHLFTGAYPSSQSSKGL